MKLYATRRDSDWRQFKIIICCMVNPSRFHLQSAPKVTHTHTEIEKSHPKASASISDWTWRYVNPAQRRLRHGARQKIESFRTLSTTTCHARFVGSHCECVRAHNKLKTEQGINFKDSISSWNQCSVYKRLRNKRQ